MDGEFISTRKITCATDHLSKSPVLLSAGRLTIKQLQSNL